MSPHHGGAMSDAIRGTQTTVAAAAQPLVNSNLLFWGNGIEHAPSGKNISRICQIVGDNSTCLKQRTVGGRIPSSSLIRGQSLAGMEMTAGLTQCLASNKRQRDAWYDRMPIQGQSRRRSFRHSHLEDFQVYEWRSSHGKDHYHL